MNQLLEQSHPATDHSIVRHYSHVEVDVVYVSSPLVGISEIGLTRCGGRRKKQDGTNFGSAGQPMPIWRSTGGWSFTPGEAPSHTDRRQIPKLSDKLLIKT